MTPLQVPPQVKHFWHRDYSEKAMKPSLPLNTGANVMVLRLCLLTCVQTITQPTKNCSRWLRSTMRKLEKRKRENISTCHIYFMFNKMASLSWWQRSPGCQNSVVGTLASHDQRVLVCPGLSLFNVPIKMKSPML